MAVAAGARQQQAWLFSRTTDLAVFAGSAAASVGLVLFGGRLGIHGETPLWVWALLVVGVDVSHVWASIYRVYLDGTEVRRRPWLYLAAPVVAYGVGVAAHLQSPGVFWRMLAYAALIHFIRQQYGWVALYGRRAGTGRWDRRLDAAAIYAATLGPVVWWHAHLPRPFWWFVEGDFAAFVPRAVGTVALAVHAAVLGVWVARQVGLALGGRLQSGKCLLVVSTWVTWFGGIVLAESDFAFTVMNVVLHGVPYFALVFRYAKGRASEAGYRWGRALVRVGFPGFAALLLALAYLEEWGWDRLVWHDHPQLFGLGAAVLSPLALALWVPLLALPQAVHYLLDAFIWKPSTDPALSSRLGWRG